MVPCLLPSSQMFLFQGSGGKVARLLTPPEALALMGFDLNQAARIPIKGANSSTAGASVECPCSARKSSGAFSWGEIFGLAGNAFSGFSFSAVAVAALHLLSLSRDPASL